MKIKLLAVGKTDSQELENLIAQYAKRVNRFLNFELEVIPDIKNTKNMSEGEQKQKEALAIQARIDPADTLVLLDENGKQYSSLSFADYLQQLMNSGVRNLVLVIGGPYGLDDSLKQKAQGSWSLSKLTFSHQMVRLFATEQIYRALSILNNQPYHHR